MGAKDFFTEINYGMNRYLTPVVKFLFILCIVIFLLQFTLFSIIGINQYFIFFFAHIPYSVIIKFQIWRLVTYSLIHLGGLHLLFNMLALWFFAPELEIKWGKRKFIYFLLVTAIGAALFHTLIIFLQALIKAKGSSEIFSMILFQPMIGASGIIYGILIANLVYFPDRTVLFNFLLPMKMKYFVIILILLEFINSVGSARGIGNMSDNISHITHLGGALAGYLFIKIGDYLNYRLYKKRFGKNRFDYIDF